MFLLIDMTVHFFFNARMEFRKNPIQKQWNQTLDAVVTILKYKKITINHAIYIKVLSYGIVSYLKVSIGDVLNTTNHDIAFPDLH